MQKTPLRIRPMVAGDIERVNTIRNHCVEYLHDQTVYSLGDARRWFSSNCNPYFIIEKSGVLVGYFRTSNYSLREGTIYVGADIHPDFWGQGIAQQSYPLMLDKLFDEYGVEKVLLEVIETNKRALHLYKKIGFVETATKHKEVLTLKGLLVDSIVMSLDKESWRSDESTSV